LGEHTVPAPRNVLVVVEHPAVTASVQLPVVLLQHAPCGQGRGEQTVLLPWYMVPPAQPAEPVVVTVHAPLVLLQHAPTVADAMTTEKLPIRLFVSAASRM
jgi:hypothetical protein